MIKGVHRQRAQRGFRVLAEDLLAASRSTAESVEDQVPSRPGYYAIFADRPESLGKEFEQLLRPRQTQLIYVGIAKKSLQKRLVGQDLRHKGASTFFRGLGAMLGYRPISGSLVGKANQSNYRFRTAETREIITWINAHLSVSWIEAPAANLRTERMAIASLRPLMNTDGNPEALSELAQLRKECRQIACLRPAAISGLLKEVRESNVHSEVDVGTARGREIW